MSERPLVSVIVPCFNAEKTVTRTLDSLAAQTLRDLEIVAVNDGSTDHTLDVLNHWKDDHPDVNIVIYSKENEGIAETRNFGVARVSGKYFGFLDSDDYTAPGMYRDLSEKAEEEDLELVISDFYWVNSKGDRLQNEGPYACGQDMMVKLFAVLWNKLYRTDFIRSLDIRFPKGYRYEDDCYLYCMVPHLSKIGFTLGRGFVRYVQQENSITHNNNEQVKNMIHVFEIILDYYKSHGLYDEYRDALEYIHIKAFLGNSFLRSCKIRDPIDRKNTVMLGWELLNREFPDWHKNPYLKSLGGMKNRYFSMVYDWNIGFLTWFFHVFGRDNI